MATNSVGQQKDTNKEQTHLPWKFVFFNGIIFVNDLLLDTDTADSFEIISSKMGKTNFLTWARFRHSVPLYLKTKKSTPSEMSLLITIDNKDFDVVKKEM